MRTSRLLLTLGTTLLTASVSIGGEARAQQDPPPCAPGQMRCETQAQRAAAAQRAKELRKKMPKPRAPLPGATPDYFGPWPNWAWSPPLRKFVDTLPGLTAAGANNLGQFLAVGVPDTTTFPGSDYYEIAVKDYTEKMHSDLPPTKLRGYVQLNTTPAPNPHYLGPVLVGQKDRPIRIKFVNQVAAGTGGNLFIPVDTLFPGAGDGYDYKVSLTNPPARRFGQNRATLHLHGGDSPWISDGTPHQWTAPASEDGTIYALKGVATEYVPDMWYDAAGAVIPTCAGRLTCAVAGASNNPGLGAMTFYYPNQQSARLMFYHDHSYGITRLNVYVGEAAGYVVRDPVEQTLITGGTIGTTQVAAGTLPAAEIPLIIQDKTFVDATGDPATNANHIDNTDPTWNWGSGAPGTRVTGDLWFPHVYMPTQNPADLAGMNPMGRWAYGPWFWPVFAPITYMPLPASDPNCINSTGYDPALFQCPATPNPSLVPEGFVDTPLVNGTAYPRLNVDPKAYRFRILNACNDRSLNLSLFLAGGLNLAVTDAGSGQIPGTYTVPITGCTGAVVTGVVDATGILSSLTVTTQPTACTAPVAVDFTSIGLVSDPTTPFKVGPAAVGAFNSDPTMMLALSNDNPGTSGLPPTWPTFPKTWPRDLREGGVPDPRTKGPDWLQIGTEGGLLPEVAVVPANPTNYEYNRGSITVLNVSDTSLFLMAAERADVVVDFSAFAGKTLILYNDAPSPQPAFDPRVDFYTGSPDFSYLTGDGTGGHTSTLPGYGPNTRTIMQIVVSGATPVPFDKVALQTALPAAFAASQPPPIIPEPAFNAAYGKAFSANYARIQSNSMTFVPFELVGTSTAQTTQALQPKAIQELFDLDWGRMNATLGVELPFTNAVKQTTIPYGYIDPATEKYAGTTQAWKITHNGVDSHPVHFHLYNVQVINRIGWDGAIKPPAANEVGWKETVRMNPLEDIVVAARPLLPELPFPLKDSIRPLDVTRRLGTSGIQYTNVDPLTGNPVTVVNANYNFGHEYVWHCHILGHEENDFMRPVVARKPATDLNFDSWPDLVWRHKTNQSNFATYLRGGAAIGGGPFATLASSWKVVGFSDFDVDGNVDIVWRNSSGGAGLVWYMNGLTVRAQASLPNVSGGYAVVEAADFDGNGQPDLLVRNPGSGANAIYVLKNGTQFNRSVAIPAQAAAWEVAGAGDFDGDGNPDIVWRNPTTGANEVWYMAANMTRKGLAPLPARPAGPWKLVAVGDYNQDGFPDLLYRETTGLGRIQAILLNGVLQTGTLMTSVASTDQNWEIVGPR